MTEYLPWDSEFFQRKTGKIIISGNNLNEITNILNSAYSNNFNVVYAFCSEDCLIDNDVLSEFHGVYVDEKIQYKMHVNSNLGFDGNVEEYNSDILTDELKKLAILSGKFSRFFNDAYFPKEDFFKLYHTWISKSVRKEIADYVFVIGSNAQITSMITLKIDKNKGEIGLFAVDPFFQRKGNGKQLIEKCKRTLLEYNIDNLNVTTQKSNIEACRFYERSGFRKIQITNVYHFWL